MAQLKAIATKALFHPILFIYELIQIILEKILAPAPPPPNAALSRPKIAVIGAGLTGVSAASHCVGHGFETVIFEAGGRKTLGGIWSVRHERVEEEASWLTRIVESQ
jgi:NADPH-dependent 2,4-dienoyl-CoA reductase/sulfur reductase-like enzyme